MQELSTGQGTEMSTRSAPERAYLDDLPDDYKPLSREALWGWTDAWVLLGGPRVSGQRMQTYLHLYHATRQGASPEEALRRVNLTSGRLRSWVSRDPLFRRVLQSLQRTVYLRLYERAFRADMEAALELWLELPTVPALLMATGVAETTLKRWRREYPWFRQAFERIKRRKVAEQRTNWTNWYDPALRRWKRVRPLPERE